MSGEEGERGKERAGPPHAAKWFLARLIIMGLRVCSQLLVSESLREADKRMPYVVLCLVLLLNSACAIGNYSPAEPARQPPAEPPSNQRELLSLSYLPESRDKLEGNPQNLPLQSQALLDRFEHYSGFMKVIVTSIPPAIGTHVNVYQSVVRHSSPWCTASNWSLGFIPCYFEGIAYETHFDVLVDNTLK